MTQRTVTYAMDPGKGFSEIGFRIEQRKGQDALLIRQASSWIVLPVASWGALADAIDDTLEENEGPALGKLFSSRDTPSNRVPR